MSKSKGRLTQVIGAVVDVEFDGPLPASRITFALGSQGEGHMGEIPVLTRH